jgi:RNA polymerase sigma-70 factor (ECF subfamily)
VVQDIFLAVWRRPRAWNGRGEVAAWLWGIGVRRLLDQLRRRPATVLGLLDRTGRAEPSAEELVLVGVEHGDLAGALNRLSPELRAVIQATAVDGLTTRRPAGCWASRRARSRPG